MWQAKRENAIERFTPRAAQDDSHLQERLFNSEFEGPAREPKYIFKVVIGAIRIGVYTERTQELLCDADTFCQLWPFPLRSHKALIPRRRLPQRREEGA